MATQRRFHDDPAFMTCILRVNYQTPRWQKAVRRVLRSSKGVRNLKMDENGYVEVSGMVDPNLLIKRLGKPGRAAEVCWFQFGQCSSNLFLPDHQNHHYSYAGDRRYFPFRPGGTHHCPPHLYGYDRDECYLPPATRRMPSRVESVGCCCLM